MGNISYKTYQFQPAEKKKMKEFKGEKYSTKSAEEAKIAEKELSKVQRDLRAARRAAAAAEQEVQAAKEQQNKTGTDAFTGRIKKEKMQKELGAVFEKSTQLGDVLKKLKIICKCLILEQLVSTFRKAFHSIINSRLWSSVASRFRRKKNRLQ